MLKHLRSLKVPSETLNVLYGGEFEVFEKSPQLCVACSLLQLAVGLLGQVLHLALKVKRLLQ